MAGPRALLASIGASVALVAAAALALLAVSAVFAFGGWSEPDTRSVKQPALVFTGTPLSPDVRGTKPRTSPIVVRPRARRSARTDAARTAARRPAVVRAAKRPATSRPATGATPAAALAPPVTQPAAPPPPPPAPKPSAGETVRKVGEDLSATVESTGAALAQVTQPLAPPVSSAVQEVINVVAALVRKTTSGLGGTLDGVLKK
jgi:hypothetical protein